MFTCSEVGEGLVLVLEIRLEGEQVLEALVCAPTDGGRGRLEHHAGTQPL